MVDFREELHFRCKTFVFVVADYNEATPSRVAQDLDITLNYLGIVAGSELNIETNGSQIVSQLWVNITVQQ